MDQRHFTLLIRTKLAPPRAGRTLVRREQLLATLAARRNDKLTLILGPAGSGKSTLSAMWRQQLAAGDCDVAWYNIGPDDDDERFAAYVEAAFESVGVALAADALAIYNRSGGKSFDAFLAVLINDVYRHPRPLYLVLEDFHYVRSPAIVSFIDRLLALAPDDFHLVISSRVRPSLDLVRLRVKDQLCEVGFDELRFSFEESVHFLHNQGVEPLSATQLRKLYLMTDGWAAGLQLIVFSLRKSKDPQAYLERFAEAPALTREHNLRNYLRQCVADYLEPEELGFLVRISACPRFTPELCEHLTGNARAAELLAKFEAENLFVIPIEFDDRLPWYRFHRLFAAFLNEQLEALPGDELRQLHQRGSRWFAARRLYTEAIHHARQAGDDDACVELIAHAARPMLNGAQFLHLLKWFDGLPHEQVQGRYELLHCVAWAQVLCGATDAFEWSIAAIEAHPQSRPPEARLEVNLLKSCKMMRLDDSAAALDLLSAYLDAPLPPIRPFARMLLCNMAGMALVAGKQFERARDLVRDRPRYTLREGRRSAAPFVDAIVGMSFLAQGEIWLAQQSLSKTLDEARRAGISPDAAAYVASYLAVAHYQLGELEQADELMAEYAELVEVVGLADSVLQAYRVRAQLHHAAGRSEAAFAMLDRMEESAQRGRLPRLLAVSLALRTHFEIQDQRLPAARESLRRLQPIAERYRDCGPCAWAEIPFECTVVEAELAIATQQPAQAWRLIEPLIGACDAQGRLFDAALLRVRGAVALAQLGQAEAAAPLLRQALAAASEYGMARLFVDAGDAATRLLREQVEVAADLGEGELAYVHATLRPPEAEPDAAQPQAEAAPSRQRAPDALSQRELEVLGLLAKALSTKSIARVLNLSAGTVKWHLKHVYSKLDAASREQAVIKARSLRLID